MGVGRGGWTSCSESHSTGPTGVAPGATGHWAMTPSGGGQRGSGLRCHRSRASPQGSAVLWEVWEGPGMMGLPPPGRDQGVSCTQ